MTNAQATLTEQIVERNPLASDGYSGNTIERVRLGTGRQLVLKRVSPEWDWLSRATDDRGRIVTMWERGLFDRIPDVIEHATVAVEADPPAWSVFMRDVSAALFGNDRRLGRADLRRVFAGLARLHDLFRGTSYPDLCSIEDRCLLLSPRTVARERALGHSADTLARGWHAFLVSVPRDLADVARTLVERPSLIADQLRTCEQTLVHGDVRLGNLGFDGDRVVLIDWGDRTGTAPAAVDLWWFLGFDAGRLDLSRDDVVDEFRSAYGDRHDERALQMALLAGFVQLSTHFGAVINHASDDADVAAAQHELSWWTTAAYGALETWSPT